MKYQDIKFKKDRVAFLKEKLANDQQWAVRGLLAIYAHQTADEQASGDVAEDNGVGFTGADGEILSSFAQRVESGRDLTDRQMELLFKKMPKYGRQLMNIADEKQEQENAA